MHWEDSQNEQNNADSKLQQGSQGEELINYSKGQQELYQQEQSNKGVIYMSRIPPYMTPNYVRKLLNAYSVQRIYFLPESEWARNHRIKRGGSKRICFREGWIEFMDKRLAKMVVLTLNGQKMMKKKGDFYSEDVWNLKYLSKFKWHHLTQRLSHEQRLKKQRLKMQFAQQKKAQQHYSSQAKKSQIINGILRKKQAKGKQIQKQGKKVYQKQTIGEQED